MPRSSSRRSGAVAGPRELDTPEGTARVHPVLSGTPAADQVGSLVLGHGAGGGIAARDLQAVAAAAAGAGWQVTLVEQPWKVAGRRAAVAPPRLDVAWLAVLESLAADRPAGSLVVGGRSAGARVACRTALATGADAVCCLAFPLHWPGNPANDRSAELAGAGVPALVVQGERDPFGTAAQVAALDLPGVSVVAVPGDHALRATAPVTDAVLAWLGSLSGLSRPRSAAQRDPRRGRRPAPAPGTPRS